MDWDYDMSLIVVDVESDGPAPGLYSMVCFGAVEVNNLSNTFYGETAPISDTWQPEALAISGITRDRHLQFADSKLTMNRFDRWLAQFQKPTFITDNLAYDWQFINYYFALHFMDNPFGWSGRRIGDLWTGFQSAKGKPKSGWKHLRDTKHTHDPEDDALGNAEALLKMREMGINI